MRYLRTVDLPVDELVDWPGNPRTHDDELIDESITLYGQTRSVMCRELPDGRVQLLGGHGTRDGFKRAGHDTVRCEVLEVTRDDIARGIVSMDNRTNDRGGYDDELLLAFLSEAESSQGLDGTGWSTDDLDDLRAQMEEAAAAAAADASGNPSGGPDGNVRQTRGLDDLIGNYAANASRVIMLTYDGAQYVWMVEQLGALGQVFDLDANADVVLRLVEQATGSTAPAPEEMEGTPDGSEDASTPQGVEF